MAQLICLANSRKHEERCIAGIDPATGQWIRPVCALHPDDGRVPTRVRLINGTEPQLLDILDIPLETSGLDFGFESENRTIAPGSWQRIGKAKATDLLPYCVDRPHILHNSEKFVTVPALQALPIDQRHTIELIYATEFSVQMVRRILEGRKWRGSLVTLTGQQLTNASITDPVFIDRLEAGYRPQNPCLVTVSLSMPYRHEEWEGDDPCWKLIAGVIELTDTDLIWVEMQRIGWNVEQGRAYLQERWGKQARHQLTADETHEFLEFLRHY